MSGEAAGQRIDKWLWYARFFKTRGLATQMVQTGRVRITGPGRETERVGKASQTVKCGDVLTFPQGATVRIVKVVAPGTRRGPAAEAQLLYDDLDPPEARASRQAQGGESEAETPSRERGAGRPTKRERRAIDKFTGGRS